MILYTLMCDAGHGFESWFPGSAAYDDQAAAGLVVCPACGSPRVAKSIMAPAVLGQRPAARDDAEKPIELALLDDKRREIRTLLRTVRDKILAEGQDVGDRFPDQARRMHDGEIEVRPIHGQATPNEARALLEDGILVLPIPVVPEELN